MSGPEMSEADLPRLHLGPLPVVEPSADLWQRIAATQQLRRRRRLVRFRAGAAAAAVVLGFGAWLAVSMRPGMPAVDWQARAQALELELRAREARDGIGQRFVLSADAQVELVRVDAALQAAYDDGADGARVEALWKRRSELLAALLHSGGDEFTISRI
jgi:hypothetical protein